jgi:hypothetical protein
LNNWVFLQPSSGDGFTFESPKYWHPEGVVVKPGQSYTFPLTVIVLCPMKNGTYNLSFVMEYTATSPSGATANVPFGERYQYTVTVATPSTTVASSGLSKFIKTGTPKAIIPQNVETGNVMTGLSADSERKFTTRAQVTPAKSPLVTTSFSQVTTKSTDSQVASLINWFIENPSKDRNIITQNNTLVSRFPLISGLFRLGLFQDE